MYPFGAPFRCPMECKMAETVTPSWPTPTPSGSPVQQWFQHSLERGCDGREGKVIKGDIRGGKQPRLERLWPWLEGEWCGELCTE